MGAVGAYINGMPMVCGGEVGGKECHGYEFGVQTWVKLPVLMLKHRQEAAGLTLANGSWLVIGGKSTAEKALSDSEIFINRKAKFFLLNSSFL